MSIENINRKGLVLIGCGRMGGALLRGWIARGIAAQSVTVIDPGLAADSSGLPDGIRLNDTPPDAPAVLVLAVKPQLMSGVLADVRTGPETLVVSVAAGLGLDYFGGHFPQNPIIRVMPNTPAAIGHGVSALIGNDRASPADLELTETLMRAVGHVVRLESEAQMNAVTALSGSGPAYVFHMIEAMAQAGEAMGLPPEMALTLARETVAGAARLATADDTLPATLRENVTSPGGTTAAALAHLMDPETGLPPLMLKAMRANAARSEELAQ